jgi:site-specific recombinase XerD
MKTPNKEVFQTLLQKFFLVWLMERKSASPETIKSYRDTFRNYIGYLYDSHGIAPEKMSIESVSAEYIIGFLNHLESARGNSARTLNNRLAAIHSFLHFISFEAPEQVALVRRSLMIPFRKETRCQIDFLTKPEVDAMLAACQINSHIGQRDYVMLLLLYNTGMRVSELTTLKRRDVFIGDSHDGSYVKIMGKGRKQRSVPLWNSTSTYVVDYMEKILETGDAPLLRSRTGGALTRSGIRDSIDRVTREATLAIPSLANKRIGPHTWRHTTALHMLQSGINLSTIAIWLGHESITTTHKYMEVDLEMKRQALASMGEPESKGMIYHPEEGLLAFLSSL